MIKPSTIINYRNLTHQLVNSDFIKKIAQTFLTRVGLIIIGMGTSILVARALGPEGRGLYSVAMTIAAIGVQFLNLGLHASNTYYVAKNDSLLSKLIGNSLVVSFLLGSLGGIIALITFKMVPSLAPLPNKLIILSLIWIPLGLAYLLGQNLLIGVNLIKQYNKIELITKIFSVALIGALLLLKKVSVISIFSTGLIALGLGLTWTYSELLFFDKRIPKPSLSIFKSNFGYGVKAYLAAFFGYLVIRLDLLMVQHFLGSEQTGYYSIAANIADLLLLLPTVVGTILFPKLSQLESIKEKWSLTKKTSTLLGIVMSIVLIFTYFLAMPLIKILFGAPFVPSVPALIYLIPGIGLFSINTILMNYFASNGMPPITIISPALGALLNIILNLKLIPKLGIIGASICSTIAYSLMLLLSVVYLIYFQQRNRS